MQQVVGIDHIAITVSDLEATCAFYDRLFGARTHLELPVSAPALYIAGDRDPVIIKFPGMDRHIADMAKFVPQLRGTIMLRGCGHITQEERAAEVNDAVIDFIGICLEPGLPAPHQKSR
jgi:pimeloyl-ACP methyl ester carboxylesterase